MPTLSAFNARNTEARNNYEKKMHEARIISLKSMTLNYVTYFDFV